MRIVRISFALVGIFSLASCGLLYPNAPPHSFGLVEEVGNDTVLTLTISASRSELESALQMAVPACGEDKVRDPQTCLSPPGSFILQNEGALVEIDEKNPDHKGNPNAPPRRPFKIAGQKLYYKAAVWRFLDYDPIRLVWSGDRLNASMPLRYHAALFIEKPIGGGYIQIDSCGYGEPARRGRIDLAATVSAQADWTLKFSFDGSFAGDNRFGSAARCEVLEEPVFLAKLYYGLPMLFESFPTGIDIVPRVHEKLSSKVVDSLNSKASSFTRGLNFQLEASKVWLALQEPRQLADGFWFQFLPSTANLSKISYDSVADRIEVSAQIEGRASVSSRKPVAEVPRPLPPLGNTVKSKIFDITLHGQVGYDTLSAHVQKLVAQEYTLAKPFDFIGVRIRRISLYPNAPDIVARIELSGLLMGHLFLIGRTKITPPDANKLGGTISFSDLDFSQETRELLQLQGPILENTANRVLAQLRERASLDLHPILADLKAKSERSLNYPLSAKALLRSQIERVEVSRIELVEDGIEVTAHATGKSEIQIEP